MLGDVGVGPGRPPRLKRKPDGPRPTAARPEKKRFEAPSKDEKDLVEMIERDIVCRRVDVCAPAHLARSRLEPVVRKVVAVALIFWVSDNRIRWIFQCAHDVGTCSSNDMIVLSHTFQIFRHFSAATQGTWLETCGNSLPFTRRPLPLIFFIPRFSKMC